MSGAHCPSQTVMPSLCHSDQQQMVQHYISHNHAERRVLPRVGNNRSSFFDNFGKLQKSRASRMSRACECASLLEIKHVSQVVDHYKRSNPKTQVSRETDAPHSAFHYLFQTQKLSHRGATARSYISLNHRITRGTHSRRIAHCRIGSGAIRTDL